MKRIILILLILSLPLKLMAQKSSTKTEVTRRSSAENVNELAIENGLTVFTLEDYSNPLVRIEVNIRAGVSLQNSQNAGFFKLLAILIKESAKTKFDVVQCNADSTRFILTISPSALEEVFSTIADDIFNPVFSDTLLKQELAAMKHEVLQNNEDPSYLINSSIDARVFANEPWKHDTGIYPALFSKIKESDARILLNEIHEDFYNPQNAAIFVSGNINSAEIINFIENTFGRFYSNKKISFHSLKTTIGTGIKKNVPKKFVIHDKQFSEWFTQIVVQYVSFENEEAEVTASILNNDNSKFKKDVVSIEELNIISEEYIDVATAYKTGCTRMIFQSLMQTSEKANPLEQTMKFLDATKTKFSISYNEFVQSFYQGNSSYNRKISTSSNFMDVLSQFWAIKPYVDIDDSKFPEQYHSLLSYQMQKRNENFKEVNLTSVSSIFQNEMPYVFVILNSDQYKKCKKDFDEQGFEEITLKNGSWYTQALYKNIKSYEELMQAEAKVKVEEINFAKNFYENNKASISTTTLSNGINLCVKENPNTTGVTFVISIEGGSLNTANEHGLEEVMINLLTTNIAKQVEKKKQQKLILNDYSISYDTKLDFSRIIIECDADDLVPIFNSCANAFILEEVIPSDADIAVQGRRTRKRLENASAINQMYSVAINNTLPNSDYVKIFETKKEILENMTYEKIWKSYTNFLYANRFSLIVSGNIKAAEVKTQASKVFSVLKKQVSTNSTKTNTNKNETNVKNEDKKRRGSSKKRSDGFPAGKQEKVRITHTFLTDISAASAGQMPEKLVPTKNFSDPVLYCLKAPDFSSDDYFIFNAILPYIQNAMNEFAENKNGLANCNVSAIQASSHIPMAIFTLSSVDKTSVADNAYKSVLKTLKDDLSNITTSEKTTRMVKDTYIFSEFQDALTNTGSAILIDDGKHELQSLINTGKVKQKNNGEIFYLENYLRVNEISAEEIISVLDTYFDFGNLYRLYSYDSKR